MKVNEMRIGNWYDENGATKQVNPNTIEAVWVAERIWCKPIPLTEEWLLKFGFEIDGFWAHKTKKISPKKLLGYMNGGNIFICQIGEHIRFQEVFLCNCQYVHQLQNLYFALTSEELEILNIKTKN